MSISHSYPQHPNIAISASSFHRSVKLTPYCFSATGALSAFGAFTFLGAAAFLAFVAFGAATTLSFFTFGAVALAFFGAAAFFSVAAFAFFGAAGFAVLATVAFFVLGAATAVAAFLTGA